MWSWPWGWEIQQKFWCLSIASIHRFTSYHVSCHFAVHSPQPRELKARVRHRLRHPVVPGLHLPDPGGLRARRRGGRGGHRQSHPHGGFGGIFPGIPDSNFLGDLPWSERRAKGRAEGAWSSGDSRGQQHGRGEADGAEADAQRGRGGRARGRVRGVRPPTLLTHIPRSAGAGSRTFVVVWCFFCSRKAN